MTKYRHVDGVPFLPSGGLLLPQVYAWDFSSSRVTFTDDLLFSENKKGLFQLLLLPDSPEEVRQLVQAQRELPKCKHVIAEETTILIQSETVQSFRFQSEENMVVARLATGEEFAQSDLCRNRPAPQYYDSRQISKEIPGVKFVLVRPDRFVYAACRDSERLAEVLDGLAYILLS